MDSKRCGSSLNLRAFAFQRLKNAGRSIPIPIVHHHAGFVPVGEEPTQVLVHKVAEVVAGFFQGVKFRMQFSVSGTLYQHPNLEKCFASEA